MRTGDLFALTDWSRAAGPRDSHLRRLGCGGGVVLLPGLVEVLHSALEDDA
jgi:hypothetical protein